MIKNPKGDMDLSAEGDLNDPNYHFGRMIWGVVKNLLAKAINAPYKLLVSAFSVNEEDLRDLKFDYMQGGLNDR